MIYNAGWANLKPQESKYTATLAAEAAKLIEAGETLSAVSRSLNISRASLRNWRSLNPKLNASFAVFEANKAKAAQHQQHVAKYKQVAQEIVDSARDGAADPVEAGVKAHQQAEHDYMNGDRIKPCSDEERWLRASKWAVMKQGRKRAVKLYDNEREAQEHLNTLGGGHELEFRKGEPVRCLKYCPVATFCPQFQSEVWS